MAYHRCVHQNDIEGNVHLTRVHPVTQDRAVDHDTIIPALSLVTSMKGWVIYPTPHPDPERVDVCRITSGRVQHSIYTQPRIGSEYVGSRCCCGSQGPLCVSLGGLTPMTQTPHAQSCSTAPCVHDLLGTACLMPGLRCGSEFDVVSCRHVPPSPCQGHPFPRSVTYTTPFPLPPTIVFFSTGNTREQKSIPTSQIRADDGAMLIGEYTRVAHCVLLIPQNARSSASLGRMWSSLHATVATRSLQKDPQRTNEQSSSMPAFRTTQLRRAKERSRSFEDITDRAIGFSSNSASERRWPQRHVSLTFDTPPAIFYPSKVLEAITSHAHRVKIREVVPEKLPQGSRLR